MNIASLICVLNFKPMGCHLLLRTEWLRLIIGLHEILTFTRMQELFICIASMLKKKKKKYHYILI